MKKTFLVSVLASSLVLIFSACSFGAYPLAFNEPTVDDRVKTITALDSSYLPETDGSDVYSFLLVTDMHFGADRYEHNDDRFFVWMENQFDQSDATMRPRFVINLGDIADTGDSEQFNDYKSWCQKVVSMGKTKLGTTDYKIYNVVGNHDLYRDGRKYFPDLYPNKWAYSFQFKNGTAADNDGFTFWFLDTGNGSFGKYQFEDMKKKMPKDDKRKIVLTHYPIYAESYFGMVIMDTLERAQVLTLFAQTKVKEIYEGHIHVQKEEDFGKFYELAVPAYSQYSSCCLVTVNESTGKVTRKVVKF